MSFFREWFKWQKNTDEDRPREVTYEDSIRNRRLQICQTPATPPPPPWKKWILEKVGGLVEVGFSENSDYLLVISHSG